MKGIERRLADHFRLHHGIISLQTVLLLGGSMGMVRSRIRNGTWIRCHPCVYRLATAPRSHRQDLEAAMQAVPQAVASHRSAAWLHGLLATPPSNPEVTTIIDRHRLVGLTVHRVTSRPPAVHVDRLACTTPTRTLVDLASVASATVLTRAVDVALQERLTAVPRLEAALASEEWGRRGSGALRRNLTARGLTGTPEPSVLESKMDRLLHRCTLPAAAPQHRVHDGRYRLDYAWPEARLAVEVKGYAWHSSPEAAAADAQRERELTRTRWTVLSFTWTDVTRRPEQVRRELEEAYHRGSSWRRSG